MIEVSHISKSFQGKKILDNVSFTLANHEALCIIGSVGSGKSTLLRCLSGLEIPEQGHILMHGKPHTNTLQENHHRIGMVFQSFNLFPHLTVLQNLTLAPLHVLHIPEDKAKEQAILQLDAVGMAEKMHYYPNELSAGQRQRVAIARSLVMNPDLMLFDEPTSALDPISASEVKDVLRKLKKEIPLIIVTHDLNLVSEMADRVAFIHDGKIVEYGTADEVLNNPQHEATNVFLSHSKKLIYEIRSVHFDRPELNARIEQYCNRFGMGKQAFHFVQLAVEELLNLVPLDHGLKLALTKWDTEIRMSLDLVMPNQGVMYLDPETNSDDLSFSIIQGLSDTLEETIDKNGNKLIHIELNQERLLLK